MSSMFTWRLVSVCKKPIQMSVLRWVAGQKSWQAAGPNTTKVVFKFCRAVICCRIYGPTNLREFFTLNFGTGWSVSVGSSRQATLRSRLRPPAPPPLHLRPCDIPTATLPRRGRDERAVQTDWTALSSLVSPAVSRYAGRKSDSIPAIDCCCRARLNVFFHPSQDRASAPHFPASALTGLDCEIYRRRIEPALISLITRLAIVPNPSEATARTGDPEKVGKQA